LARAYGCCARCEGLSQQALAEAAGRHLPADPEVRARREPRLGLDADPHRQDLGCAGGRDVRRELRLSGAVDEVAALLAEPGALELLKAYAGLPRGVSRSALVEFVRSLRSQPG
jgi:hypothetical protein